MAREPLEASMAKQIAEATKELKKYYRADETESARKARRDKTNADIKKLYEIKAKTAVYKAEIEQEESLQRTKLANITKISELSLERINREETAQLEAQSNVVDKYKEYEELLTKERIAQLSAYETFALDSMIARKNKEMELNKQVSDMTLAMGIEADSKLGKTIEHSIKERAALDARDKAKAENKENILGKGKTISERLVGMAKMSSGTTLSGESSSLGAVRQKRKDAQAITHKTNKEATKTVNDALEAKGINSKEDKNAALKSVAEAKAKLKAYEADVKNGGIENEELKQQLEEGVKKALEATGLDDVDNMIVEQAIDSNDEQALTEKLLDNVTGLLSDISKELESTADTIAAQKSLIDARLQGSNTTWKSISNDVSGLLLDGSVKSETVANKISEAVNKGIARDVSSMGAIEALKERVAPTFDTFNSTVLRLIKIQNTNTTYARMGMEASLNQLFNSLYQTTEYLNNLATSVKSNLEEAEALMEGVEAVDFEYQVQKWLGSLSSAGMSDSAVQSISDAFGKLAAGQVEGITEGGAGNLMVMAANNANISIADILADGLDASETNQLMNAMVNYMKELVSEANGNNVVQQQLAKVFGVSASDLKAAVNIATTYGNTQAELYELNNTYSNFLYSAANSGGEVTLPERLANMWANVKYSTATSIASDAVLYTTTKLSSILDSLAGGGAIPAITAFGTGVDTKLTISDVLRSASLVGGLTKSLVATIQNGGGLSAVQALAQQSAGSSISISSGKVTSTSGTATIYNGSVEDMEASATTEATDSAKEQTVQAKEEEQDEVSSTVINENILNIYNVLKSVVAGDDLLHVKFGKGSSSSTSEAMEVKVVNYDQFATNRYQWTTDESGKNTLTDTWDQVAITSWTHAAG